MPRSGRLIEAFNEVLDFSVAVPLSVLAPNHHVGLAAAAAGTDQPLASMPIPWSRTQKAIQSSLQQVQARVNRTASQTDVDPSPEK